MNTLKTQFLGFINTAALFQNFNRLQQFQFQTHEIEKFDFTQLEITKKLALGKRVEIFFEFYINQSSRYHLIKKNIQIIKNKHTLGELDFIIYDIKEEKYIHIEQIYKFYLYDENIPNEAERFIGPNNNDTFTKKISKLTQKQLPLFYTNETYECLKELQNIPQNSIKQQVCFKGNIYLPWNQSQKKIPLLNQECIRGFYIPKEEFFSQQEFWSLKYFLPEKVDWVSDFHTNEIWYDFNEVSEQIHLFLNTKKSPLVWSKNPKKNTTQSFFIIWW